MIDSILIGVISLFVVILLIVGLVMDGEEEW